MKSRVYSRLFLTFIIIFSVIVSSPVWADTEPQTLIVGNEVVSIATYGRQSQDLNSTPKVALVLSGGGARGFAHIPIIEAIEMHGIPVDMVLGTSMGSLVGGLYAAGYSPGDMRRLIASYDMVELFAISAMPPIRSVPLALRRDRDNLFTIGFDTGGIGNTSGIIGDQRILHMLNNSLSRVSGIDDFDDLAIPFRCIGTNLATGERIIFSEGSLVTAIRSSISIPLVFTPYPVEDSLVIDGGLVDNMPVALAREMGADIVIAVDVNAVDYRVSNEELESLSAILDQLVVILTKNTVIEQSTDADILIEPKLEEHSILDFLEVDEIIAVGKESAAAHDQEFTAIAELIGATRTLEPQDPNRFGSYFILPDISIKSVSHRQVGFSQEGVEPLDLDLFSQFVGYPLDSLRKNQLRLLFEDLRNTGSYATVTYDVNQVETDARGTILGNMEIQTRQFNPKLSILSAGIFGAISLTYDSTEGVNLYFTPDFSVRYTRYELFDSPTTLIVKLSNDDALNSEIQLQSELLSSLEFGVSAGYVTGGIHPLNLRHAKREFDVRDRMITSELFFHYRQNIHSLVKLAADFDYIWYGETSVGRETFIPSMRIEGVYTTIPFRFFPSKGFRFDYSAVAELSEPFGYRMETRLQKVISLGKRDVLWFDLHAGTSHISNPRKLSYFDYGGSRGVPSYPAHSLVDDMVLGRVKHLHWVSNSTPEIVLQTMITASSKGLSVYDMLGDTTPYELNTGTPFSSLSGIELSGSFAIGLAFENLDVIAGIALDNNLHAALFIEVL